MTQAVKMPPLRDHYLLTYILGKTVDKLFGCPFLLSAQTDARQKYPFITATIIRLEDDETSDWLGDGRQYTTRVQFDCHSNQPFQAMTMAQELYSALHTSSYRRFFTQARIVPQIMTNTSNRTVLEGVNLDHDYGFDCSFLLTGGLTFTPDELNFDLQEEMNIESVTTTDIVTDSRVTNHKQEE